MRGRLLFLENQDSFSWNVIDALPCDRRAVFVRAGREAARDVRAFDGIAAVVVGPGPTDPVRAGLVDVIRQAAARAIPMLGICLGHQALGLAFGAEVVRTVPMHGKPDTVAFGRSRLFPSIEGAYTVMRYHSLSLAHIEAPLRVVATTGAGIPMAIEHAALPMAGLQFHPDSYGTPSGRKMLAAFFEAVVCG